MPIPHFTNPHADFDGIVGFPDFIQFASAFGTSDTVFDLNDSGFVGFPNFLVFAQNFGRTVN